MDSSGSSDATSDSAPFILPHQYAAFQRLTAIGRACFAVHRKTIPVRIRTNTLIVGETGSGKTYLAQAVARELGVPFLPLALSNWVILSGTDRGAQTTWVAIAEFLYRNRKALGVVIFLDEIDKHRRPTSSWDQQTQVESFLLLDGRLPRFLKDEEGDLLRDDKLTAIQEVLANRTYIAAAGAFQHLWESRAQTRIGFGEPRGAVSMPTPDELAQTLPREIVNRMSGELVILPPLHESDYLHMLEAIAPQVPSYLRQTFERIGLEKIPAAIKMRQGCRFVEDVMLQTLLTERASVQMSPPALVAQSEKQENQKEEKFIEQDDLSF